MVIVFGIDYGEFALGKGDQPRLLEVEFAVRCRIEVSAGIGLVDSSPSADEVGFLPAAKYRPADTNHPGRKTTVVTSFYIFHFEPRINTNEHEKNKRLLTADYTD